MKPICVVAPLSNSVAAALARTGLKRAHLYTLMQTGEIRVIKVGRRTLIAEAELVRFLKDRMAKTS